jgi:hypothetical protein
MNVDKVHWIAIGLIFLASLAASPMGHRASHRRWRRHRRLCQHLVRHKNSLSAVRRSAFQACADSDSRLAASRLPVERATPKICAGYAGYRHRSAFARPFDQDSRRQYS